MFKRFVRSIRQKPKAVRDQYALWAAVIFTALVITIWFATLPERFAGEEQTAEERVSIDSMVEDRETFSDMLGGLREDIQKLSQSTTTPVATTTPVSPNPTMPTIASGTQSIVNPTTAPAVRIATFTAPRASTTP